MNFSKSWNCTHQSGLCNFSFLKNSHMQINSTLNSKPHDYLYKIAVLIPNKKTPEGVYAGWIGWSKNYVEWRACLIKTRNGEMIKWQNGETVLLKVRAKVVRYNPSNKIIERINKRTRQSRFLFQFVLVTLHICVSLKVYIPCIYLIQTSSITPFLCKVHVCQISCIKFIAKWVPFW